MMFKVLGFILLITYCQRYTVSATSIEELNQKFNWKDSPSTGDGKEVREAIFTQWVDHKNSADTATFQQIVYINDEYYQPGGPVMIFVSASSDGFKYWLQNSLMTDIASQLGGIIYSLEPRYFGRSFPTADVSLENLKNYLHINQTMADYALFITYLRSEFINYETDKFILFGHGRGGTLATWIHQRYPNLADGVWAASSPVSTMFDFGLYYSESGMLSTIYKEFPIECQQSINEAFIELDVIINNEDIDTLRNIFILEAEIDLSDQRDIALFYRKLFELLFSPVEYGTPLTINLICNSLEPLEGYSSLQLLGSSYGSALNNQLFKYNELVSILKDESLEAEEELSYDRQDLFVRCTGWSQFKTSSQLSYPFNRFPSNIFGDLCNDVFGISYNDAILNNIDINRENSFNINIQNVYFTNAEFDPHHIIGVTEDVSPTIVSNFIPKIGKLFDFLRYVPLDALSNELYEARDRAVDLVTSWTS